MFSFNDRNIFQILIGCSLILIVLTEQNYRYGLAAVAARNHVDINILNLLSRSPDLFASKPTCFQSYGQELLIILDNYQDSYDACCNDADNERSATDLATLESREDLANRTELSCNAITQCKNETTVNLEYQCYVKGGNNNYKTFQSISNEASADLANYMQKLSVINFDEEVCTNKTKEVFQDESDKLEKKFNDCLITNVWPTETTSSPKPSTSTIPPTTSTESNVKSTSPA